MYKSPITVSNKTFHISIDESPEHFFIKESHLDLSAIDSLNQFGEAVVICSLVGSSLLGSYCKSSIYYYMYQKFTEKRNTAIDTLILANTIYQHVACVLLTIFYTVGLSFDITYSEYFGETWCDIPWFVGISAIAYRTIGSLGISIVRLLLIKNNAWVKECSKRTLSSIVLILSFAISAGLAIGFKTGNGPGSRKQ